jgi:hypothetical protein
MEVIKEAGVPEFVEGKDEAEKQKVYAQYLKNRINAGFPTQSIGKMVKENHLGIENTGVAASVSKLFSNAKFDIRKHRLHDLQQEIAIVADEENADPETVKLESMKLQRLFQVSTSPEVMRVLSDNNLDSAYSIANIPRANFARLYGKAFGGLQTAITVHQRAEQIAKRAEAIVMDTRHFDTAVATPAKAMSKAAKSMADETLQNTVPNFRNLLGSRDLCECEHCRSISSPAAYFVELLQFLNNSKFYIEDVESEASKRSPYDFLVGKKDVGPDLAIAGRRPDLAELALSCENTNTLIPYIDLSNEIMEFYVAEESLENFKEENIGDVTADELRANPQRTNSQDTVATAYQNLANAKFPFSLPFHKPLDEIRTYGDFLNTSRYQVMQALHPQPNPTNIQQAMTTESLELSAEGYDILVDNTTADVALREYYGLDSATGELEDLIEVRKFLAQSGTSYVQLIELLKTRFINPHQQTIDYLEDHFSQSTIDVDVIYNWLKQVQNGDDPDDAEIEAALDESENSISIGDLTTWAGNNFNNFQQVITLFEPTSACDLDNIKLKTIKSIYEKLATSEIVPASWSKIHRFIRLWRKTNWSIHQTDLILSALGEDDIRHETLSMIESVLLLQKESKLPVNKLAVLWGNIDTYGKQSLYKKLFLNKAVQQIDEAFVADAQANYLSDTEVKIIDHQSAILAAFRLTESELETLFLKEQFNTESILNISNLSAIYRYTVLAKVLKMSVTDLCKLIGLFEKTPFNSPSDTYEFYLLAASTRTAKFKPEALDYIFNGGLPADSKLGLDTNKALLTAKTIRDGLDVIEQNHQETSEPALSLELPETLEKLEALAATLSLTPDILVAKLSLTFRPEIVNRLMAILNSTAVFDVNTKTNLGIATDISINDGLSKKFSYIEASGRLSCIGVMSDDERTQLVSLTGDSEFEISVGHLYTAPETFINNNFDGVLSSVAVTEAIAEGDDVDAARTAAQATTMSILLQRQAPPSLTRIDAKLAYVYKNFLPLLKRQLQQNLITTHVADLVGLSEEVTTLLLSEDVDYLLSKLSTKGFSASYFNNIPGDVIDWNVETNPPSLERVDDSVNFSWEGGSPDPDAVIANNFSARWTAYITPPISSEYTLVVEVAEADELFNLYLDSQLVLSKAVNDEKISFEISVTLDATEFHLLILEYAEVSGDAGVKLSWKTATSAPEIIPATVAYPAQILNDFVQQVSILHRAATFIQGFKISGAELKHFIAFNGDFDEIDFRKLKLEHWVRIRDYVTLRNSVPQAGALLTDVFTLSKQSIALLEDDQSKDKVRPDLIDKIYQATDWDKGNISALINHFFPQPQPADLSLIVNGFKDEIILNRFYKIISIVASSGLSAQSIIDWGSVGSDFGRLQKTAQALKNTVKAKYDDKEWLTVASGLSDKLREQQNQALVSYLLVEPSIQEANITDADGLYEHFLIDVQMGACMDTSRIVQANAAIQLFVNRILLNLEANIPPDVIDVDRWGWMKNYRVWEANRKVFLYPQNWLEPEWRSNRSEFFKDLESHLLQNDITERSVEQGLRNYLMSMNEVANLDVCGMHREEDENGDFKCLHVFGRSHNLPYKYFYRRWNKFHKWSAWEKVQLDIRGVEDGENSGVHLIPVVWKGRLYLFWPEFMEKAKAPELAGNLKDAGDNPASDLEPGKYWEISLAWSEYVDGAWSSKQVTKESLSIYNVNVKATPPSKFRIHPHYDIEQSKLVFLVGYGGFYGPCFILTDIHSPIKADNCSLYRSRPEGLNYKNQFTRLHADNLTLQSPFSNTYLASKKDHKVLKINNHRSLELDTNSAFFYSEGLRSYFVKPVGVGLRQNLALDPDKSSQMLSPGSSNDSGELSSGDRFSLLNNNSNDWHNSHPVNSNPGVFDVGAGGISDLVKYIGTILLYPLCEVIYGEPLGKLRSGVDHSLEFHTFHHPYASEFVRLLNLEEGIKQLFHSNTEIIPGDEVVQIPEDTIFGQEYRPKFGNLFTSVKRHTFSTGISNPRTGYLENICFDTYGANSLYNWELFFHAPLYIATRLSKNGKYSEAMHWFHYIFDPTTNEKPDANSENETSRYWKVKPFKTTPIETLESLLNNLNRETDPESEDFKEDSIYSDHVSEWRENPFDPHLVASNRPIAYMEHVVIKYIENLLDWGDSLFRQFTRENVYEAMQLYVIASHILGKRPEVVPKRGTVKTETYSSLKDKLDVFGNALVELENVFPMSSEVYSSTTSTSPNLLGIGEALYFCIPENAKLTGYWDTVEDRLFKIRHCQNIEGAEQSLALFSPPIDPAALIQARSQGLSLSNILGDLNSPPPIYRFAYLLQKANEFCNDVKSLGSAVLSALEKRDGEELGRLRASQEANLLERVTGIRERQILAAKLGIENLLKTRETAELRLAHYKELLGDDSDEPAGPPELDGNLTADGPLPVDTSISPIEADVDMSLVGGGESGVKLISKEKEALDKNSSVKALNVYASSYDLMASIMNTIPDVEVFGAPLGTGVSTTYGGFKLAATVGAYARVYRGISEYVSAEASQASILGGFLRRTHDWSFQANLAIRELIQLDKQITSADIQLQIAEKELRNHLQQIENSKEVELFLEDKFTNQELYQWMKEQLFSVYKQSYNLAFEMAKKAEKAFQYELGTETTSFIQYGYWDSSRQGLVSGEKLQLSLRQLENEYLNSNRRELELSKSISVALLNPLALIELRETGKCHLSLPEELFDLDFQGHYFRRIKAVSLSIPCIAGPYTTVNCSLRLVKNSMRKNTQMNSDGNYEHNNDIGLPLDDDRFRSSNVPVTLIATSTGQNDTGMFEFNFRDERYLPFEGAGVISDWMIELTDVKDLRQFDYTTISDVILHLKYTARETSGTFKQEVIDHLHQYMSSNLDNATLSLLMFNLKQDFPTQWHRFLHPTTPVTENIFELDMSTNLWPVLDQDKTLKVNNIWVLARCENAGAEYEVVVDTPLGPENIALTSDGNNFGGLHFGSIDTSVVINPEDQPITWELKVTLPNGNNFSEGEVEDVFLVLGYGWDG